MLLYLSLVAVLFVVCLCGWRQYQLYWEAPHDDGDPIIYVEHGCRTGSSSWIGLHYDTLVVTHAQLILNDVLTFYSGYRFSRPFTHCIDRRDITGVDAGSFRLTAVSLPGNLRVRYRDRLGNEQSVWIKSRDPRSVEHLLSKT